MIDLHHHLLFGIDDGSPDLATSVAMVEMAAADGVTHIVATPHANDEYAYDRARNEALLQQIRDALPPSAARAVTLGLGSDFHLSFENTEDIRTRGPLYAINDGPYLLVELADTAIPHRIDEVFYTMRVNGLTPILTHPERNATLQRSRTRLRSWLGADLLVQVTAGSLTGTFGKVAEKIAWELLTNNWAHFVSSDAHNLTRRTPRLSEAYGLVSKRLGAPTAQRLFVTNPLAVFEGRPLPPQPEPLGIYGDAPQTWLQRLIERFR